MRNKELPEILDIHNRDFEKDIEGLDMDTEEYEKRELAAMKEMMGQAANIGRGSAEMRAMEPLNRLRDQYDRDIAELNKRNAPPEEHRALDGAYYEQRAAIITAEMESTPPLPLPERVLKALSSSEIGQKTQGALEKTKKFFDDDLNKLLVGSAIALPLVAEGLGALPPDKLLQTYAIVAGMSGVIRLGSAGIDKLLSTIHEQSK